MQFFNPTTELFNVGKLNKIGQRLRTLNYEKKMVQSPDDNINLITCSLIYNLHVISVCDAFRDLVSFVQFKKREKHPCRSVTLSKVASF